MESDILDDISIGHHHDGKDHQTIASEGHIEEGHHSSSQSIEEAEEREQDHEEAHQHIERKLS